MLSTFSAFSKKKDKKVIHIYIYFYIYIIISLFWLKQDIRWCKKISGKFKVMSLQDRSQTVITSRSKDGCRVIQKSVIFYHVSQNDTLLDIMCESGYPDYGYECGERGINLQIRIPITLIERGKNTSLSVLYVMFLEKSVCIFTTNMYMYLYLFMSFCKMWLYIFGRVA